MCAVRCTVVAHPHDYAQNFRLDHLRIVPRLFTLMYEFFL